MSKLTLDIQLLSPTVIAQRPTSPGQITRSPDYLSGTVLRGGIAGLWRERCGTQDETHFQAIFVQGQLRFGNAWPQQPSGRTWIVPQSAATEKRGGWFADGDAGVNDLLTLLLREAEPDDMEPVGDTFVCEDTGKGTWTPLMVRRRLISRTALERAPAAGMARGVAADGQLYSFEALETGQRLRATISGPDHLITVLAKLLDARPTITVGQGRSRGLGLVEISQVKSLPEPERDDNALVEAITRFSALAGVDRSQRLLPVTLESDTLLRDNYLLACSSADPHAVLSRYRQRVPASMELVYALQATHWIGGWEQIRRLPRPPQLAVTQGSVWVFGVATHELPTALAWWHAVEEHSLGERCAEGFGQIRLLHPFHDYREAEEDRRW